MKFAVGSLVITALWWGVLAPSAYAQKGMGDPTGVARQASKPEIVPLSGKVLGIETGPCQMSTGRSSLGTHFLLETPDGEKLNVHLGPAAAVKRIADQLPVGKEVAVEAFRTAKMPENHYVAQSVAFDGNTIRLRDETLRPFWLQGGPVLGGRGMPRPEPDKAAGRLPGRRAGYGRCPAWGPGRGYGGRPGRGFGAGYGRGPARRAAPGYGRGPGWGRGPGYGWGPGRAARRGPGFGRGWGAFLDEDGDGVCDNYESLRAGQPR